MASRKPAKKPDAQKFDSPGPSLSELLQKLEGKTDAEALVVAPDAQPAAAVPGYREDHQPPETAEDIPVESPTLGELGIIPDIPPEAEVQPGFEMSDEPLPPPVLVPDAERTAGGAFPHAEEEDTYTSFVNDHAKRQDRNLRSRPPQVSGALDGDITPPARDPQDQQLAARYVSRISVADTWAYDPRNLINAPDWVDRNWLGHADYDPMRKLEPGPCLRVPVSSGEIAICRPGDYVVIQSVLGDDHRERMQREVWEKSQFERFFMASRPPN